MSTRTAWKAVRPDLTTRDGFKWWPGTTVRSDHSIDPDNTGPCPSREGDGLCLAKTWWGAASAGFPTLTCYVVTFDESQVLAENEDKIRVRGDVQVGEPYDAQGLLREGWGGSADLRHADLRGADLQSADLEDANLRHADLRHADLWGAILWNADLRLADLRGADLRHADLRHADLRSADLQDASLRHADLQDADLRHANLRGANLQGADLPVSLSTNDARQRGAIL